MNNRLICALLTIGLVGATSLVEMAHADVMGSPAAVPCICIGSGAVRGVPFESKQHVGVVDDVLASNTNSATSAASVFLFQWDLDASGLTGNTYQDGALIQSVPFSDGQYPGDYGLWNGAVLSDDVDVAVNVLNGDGDLSETWHIFGDLGQDVVSIPFLSDINGQALTALLSASTLVETGDWQTVTEFDVSNGDHYIWQFRADAEVPEPAALGLIAVGLLSLLLFGAARESRALSASRRA